MTVCRRSFSLTRKGDLVNDGDEMVVLPTSPTSAVPGGDTCVTSSCLERHMSAVETKKFTAESPLYTLETSVSIVETLESTAETHVSAKESFSPQRRCLRADPSFVRSKMSLQWRIQGIFVLFVWIVGTHVSTLETSTSSVETYVSTVKTST